MPITFYKKKCTVLTKFQHNVTDNKIIGESLSKVTGVIWSNRIASIKNQGSYIMNHFAGRLYI